MDRAIKIIKEKLNECDAMAEKAFTEGNRDMLHAWNAKSEALNQLLGELKYIQKRKERKK